MKDSEGASSEEQKEDVSTRANVGKEINDSSALPVVNKPKRGRKPKSETATSSVVKTPPKKGRPPKVRPVPEENKDNSDTESLIGLNGADSTKKSPGRKLPTTKINAKRLNSNRGDEKNPICKRE